jgi:hypothetical protein
VDKFIPIGVPILVILGLSYLWPPLAIMLLCALIAAPFYWGIKWISKLSARFIKRLYPGANEDSLEMGIFAGIMVLAWPVSVVLIFIWFT